MDKFRTPIHIASSAFKLAYPHAIFNIGSCFSEHLHVKFREVYFNSYCNPCGIVYNPISIGHQLMTLIEGKQWSSSDLVYQNGLFHGLHHHGSFSDMDKENVLQRMNEQMFSALEHFKKSALLICTLGTALVYRHRLSGEIVANCHKIPSSHFDRTMLSVEEIVAASEQWIKSLCDWRPDLNIILTISPIRYLKEGFTDNSRSKARLILATETLTAKYDRLHYFPSYEILLDDLRDYRFYKSDMIHPNDLAIDYIWDLFCKTYMSKATIVLMDRLHQIKKSRNHKPLHNNSPEYIDFLKQLDRSVQEIRLNHPDIILDDF